MKTKKYVFSDFFKYLEYQKKQINQYQECIKSVSNNPLLDYINQSKILSKSIRQTIFLPGVLISEYKKLSLAGLIDFEEVLKKPGNKSKEYRVTIEPDRITKSTKDYLEIFDNVGAPAYKRINELKEKEIAELKKAVDKIIENFKDKKPPFIINVPKKIELGEAEKYKEMVWINRLQKDFGIFSVGEELITVDGKQIQMIISDKQKLDYFNVAVNDHFNYLQNKKKVENQEKKIYLRIKKEDFFYNPETGDGELRSKPFKRFKEDTSAKKLFDEAYYKRKKKISKKKVIELLGIELKDDKIDPAKVLSALGDSNTRRKSTNDILITNSINDVVKEIRKKTGLNTNEFVNNNGNITLNI